MRKVEELPLKRSAETNKAKVAAYPVCPQGKMPCCTLSRLRSVITAG